MARHRRFSFEFKRQLVLDILEERVGLGEMARKHSISRSLIRQGGSPQILRQCHLFPPTDMLEK